ncbi:MAG: hypothetical protein QM740_18170 [Acidovorax sp.]
MNPSTYLCASYAEGAFYANTHTTVGRQTRFNRKHSSGETINISDPSLAGYINAVSQLPRESKPKKAMLFAYSSAFVVLL